MKILVQGHYNVTPVDFDDNLVQCVDGTMFSEFIEHDQLVTYGDIMAVLEKVKEKGDIDVIRILSMDGIVINVFKFGWYFL